MAITDLFSKRQKRLRVEMPSVYQYEDIPNKLRVQIVHIIMDIFWIRKNPKNAENSPFLEKKYNILAKEYGVFRLGKPSFPASDTYFRIIYDDTFLQEKDYEKVLDIIELSFRVIDNPVREHFSRYDSLFYENTDNAIKELNQRFKEHGVGYQYMSGQIIRIDSEFIHPETVKPVLHLLTEKRFKGANEEFLKAHEHIIGIRDIKSVWLSV